ncbi:MAG TPA: SCO family protein [Mycobacteriales bacterium]|nr:SCO family protein [Mycobacteriales bacterium]
MTRRVAALIVLALAVAGCGSGGSGDHLSTRDVSQQLHGAIPSQRSVKPQLTLTDTAGHPYDLRKQTQGKVTLLYFGYTHCPDECPTSMADVATALRKVGPDVARQVAVVFVTTDPWRDKRHVLRAWLDRFSPSFVGLTGTPAQIAGAEVEMGMPVSKREPAKKSDHVGRYAVAHFAAVMVYGRDNRLTTLYPSGVAPTDIAADLPVLVKG